MNCWKIFILILFLKSNFINGQTILNNGFTSGTTSWVCAPEVNPQSAYGGTGGNLVAEVDAAANLCQTVSGFVIGSIYTFSFVASRRTGGCPSPNPTNINITISGGALSATVIRTNAAFALTTASFNFTATSTTHTISMLAGAGFGSSTCGMIFDNLNILLLSALPIKLLNFEAENHETKAAITWATATEKNTNYFNIERSVDDINWETIASLKAAENSTKKLYYEYDDNEPLFGISYYRLKIIDLDNSFTYSPIKAINRNKKEAVVVFFPNPTIGVLNLISSYPSNQIKYKIFDLTGKELVVNITNHSDDKITFDFSNLAKGLYFINVTAPDGTEFSSNRIILK
jgi:hypothetical protein